MTRPSSAARLASQSAQDRASPAVGRPASVGPRHSAFRHHARFGDVPEGPGDERLVALVRPGAVEDRDARIDRRGDRLEGELFLGRQAHAAESDSQLVGAEPAHRAGPVRWTNAASRAASSSSSRRATRRSGAKGSSRTRPSWIDQSPATMPSTRNVARPHRPRSRRRDARRAARGADPRGSARGCRSAGGGGRARGSPREEAELAGGRRARARARRGTAGRSSRSSPESTTQARSPSTGRCRPGRRAERSEVATDKVVRRRSRPGSLGTSHVRAGTNVPPARVLAPERRRRAR